MKPVLDAVLDRLPGALGAAVVGPDGIPVEMVVRQPGLNLEWTAAAGMDVVRRTAAQGPEASGAPPEEVCIARGGGLTILRSVGAGYFLCLVTGPGAIAGQARYEAWRAGLQVREVIG
jgi:predicted regulator of Ras-like GTPase activity (Roadblock/LC7/MglB family)